MASSIRAVFRVGRIDNLHLTTWRQGQLDPRVSPSGSAAFDSPFIPSSSLVVASHFSVYCPSVFFSPCYCVNLDPLLNPLFRLIKELRSTLDGKHWTGAAARKPYRRSQLPAGPPATSASSIFIPSAPPVSAPSIPASVDLSRAPAKPRASSSLPSGVIQPCVLFSTVADTPSNTAGDGTGCVNPHSTGADTLSSASSSVVRSSADILSACDELDSTVLHSPSPEHALHQSSFIDHFLPLGLTGNDILPHLSAIVGSAASVVLEIFSSESQRAPVLSSAVVPPSASASDPFRSLTTSPSLRPPSSSTPPSRGDVRNPIQDEPPPTREQFRKVQRQFAALQCQLEGFVSS